MILLPITSLYASINALIIIYLAFKVTRIRRGKKIGVGTRGDKGLAVATRAHANNIETSVAVLPLLMLAELNHASPTILQVAGLGFIIGRVLHFWGFFKTEGGYSVGRFLGTLSAWVATILLAVTNLYMLFI